MADHIITYFDGKKLSRLVFEGCTEPTESQLIAMLGGETAELSDTDNIMPERFFGYRIDRFIDPESGEPEDTLEAHCLYVRTTEDIMVRTERVFDLIEPFIGLDLYYLFTGSYEYTAETDAVNNAAVAAKYLKFSGRYENHLLTSREITELLKGNEVIIEYITESGNWERTVARLVPTGFADSAEEPEPTITAKVIASEECVLPSDTEAFGKMLYDIERGTAVPEYPEDF